jgi:fatty acid desaturase
MYIILGFVIILVASALESYCSFNRQARPDIRHKVFNTRFKYLIEAAWVILLLGGGSILFFFGGIFNTAIILLSIGVVAFWLILPFIITPIIRNRLLPPWDDVKKELEPKGYNERNYWRGDWWMKNEKQKSRQRK